MKTKTENAKALYINGDIKGCLKIVKGFRLGLTKQQQQALSLGYEAIVHPAFYIQLKKNPEMMVAEAKQVLDTMFA